MGESGLRASRKVSSRCAERFVGILLENGEETLTFGVGSEEVTVLRGQDLSFAIKLQLGVFYTLDFNPGGSKIIKIATVNGVLIWEA